MALSESKLVEIQKALTGGTAIPYLGAGMLELIAECPVPKTPEDLAQRMTAKVSVPHKIRKRLTAAAQYIENFKHRKTLVDLMRQSFSASVSPSRLHQTLAGLSQIPLIVDVWYDDAMRNALAGRENWGQIHGLSQSEHFGTWFKFYGANGETVDDETAEQWKLALYQPIGAFAPAANYLVSDSDYVEVLTEIDIQTPIPPLVQFLRRDRQFLFLGCRFSDQLQRTFVRQIIKRSSNHHWAIIDGPLTRNEQRFVAEYGIEVVDASLLEFDAALSALNCVTA